MPLNIFTQKSSPSRNSLIYRLRIAIALFVLTVLIGTIGHKFLLKQTLLDAFYFTIVTLTTIGYGDIVPKDPAAKVFTISFILGGIFTASYTAAVVLGAVIEGEFQSELRGLRKVKKIQKLKDHIIICGYGRIGQDLAASFRAESIPFVVIESDEHVVQSAEAEGNLMLRGDATSDETLRLAGIERARFVVPSLASDADNLFIVMSARYLNPKVSIVARATDLATEEKMKRAGADRVVRPLHIGAQHLAQAVMRPTVLDFIRHSGRMPGHDYSLEEIAVAESASLVNRTLIDLGMKKEIGVIIIGIKRAEGELVFNPSGETLIHAGDTLVAIGATEPMDRLAALAGSKLLRGVE